MDKEKTREEVQGEAILLTPYMSFVIGCLQRDGKHPSVHTYTATLHSFTAFATSKGVPMQIPDVFTVARLKQYQSWLRQRKASWNTVSTYMRTLRAVYNRLVAAQLVIRDPHLFDEVYTKVESQTKRALTDEQTRTLAAVDPTCLPEDVQRALSYFLLMFLFRGMPFIDLAHLRRQDVNGDCITYCRHKTGRRLTVRIPHEAMQLFEMCINQSPDTDFLFPILKDGEDVYEVYLSALRRFNRSLQKMAALLLPGVKISSYTARHTWATIAYHHGWHVGIISKALGHSSIRVTETYLKPFEDEKVDMANNELIASVMGNNGKRKRS